MTTTEITRTEQAETITYTAWVDGTDAAELVIKTTTREVANVETRTAFQRQGLARALWAAASDEAECFHSLEHHRTADGDAFAHAVGGETISTTDGHEPACCICTDSDDDTDEEW